MAIHTLAREVCKMSSLRLDSFSEMDLKGKHVFLTGGGKRLGRALCEALLTEGAVLTLTYRHAKAEAEEVVRRAAALGTKAQAIALELTDFESFPQKVSETVSSLGPPSVFIGCASDFFPTPLKRVTEKEWDHFLEVNLKSYFFLIQAFLKEMKKGVIVNLVDIYAEKPLKNFTPYTVSKAGLGMMTKNLALELAPGIRVNAVSPGPVLLPENFTEEQTLRAKESTLLKRIGTPEDIVNAVLFLIQNDYMTGANLKVDGGASLV